MAQMIELNWDPEPRILRQFGWVALVGFGALAAMAWFERFVFGFGLGESRQLVAGALAGLGLLSFLFGLAWPRGNRPIFVLLSVVTFPIGFVLSYVILGAVFFGLFAPIALVFRLIGRDPLERKLDADAQTYWSKARPPRPKSDYFKQY